MLNAAIANLIASGLELPAPENMPSLVTPQVTLAADIVPAQMLEDDGSAMRVYEAGELRMLSQRIATAACAWLAGIEGAEEDLVQSVAKFDRYLDALQYGDAEIGIPTAETDRKILADIEAVHAVWDPLHIVLDDIIAGGPDPDKVLHIAKEVYPLFDATSHMAFLIMAEYTNPTQLLQADALAIDIAGRQEKLAEEIAKDACLLVLGLGDQEAERAEMIQAINTFEVSLTALHDGMPEAGVSPPPTPEITTLLESIRAEWEPVQPILDQLARGESIEQADLIQIYKTMTALTDGMSNVTKLYAEASKLGL